MVSNPECIIDTNPIINSLLYPGIAEKINEVIKRKYLKIVVCDTVFEELEKPQYPYLYPGYNRIKIREILSNLFVDSFQEYTENNNITLEAKKLEEKYESKGLHCPDSRLLAILKIESWDKIITNDRFLGKCCESEKKEIAVDPKPHADLMAYEYGLKAKVENKISNDEIKIKIKDLRDNWDWVKNNVLYDYNMDTAIFFKLFKIITFQLGKINPKFADMHKRLDDTMSVFEKKKEVELEPNLMSSFFETLFPTCDYKWIMLTLDNVLSPKLLNTPRGC